MLLTEVVYDFTIVPLSLLCVNQFIHLFIPELLQLSFHSFQCLLKVVWSIENIKQ